MTEGTYLCTVCAFEAPGPAELAEHLSVKHAPAVAESYLELVRRTGVDAGATAAAAEVLEDRGPGLVDLHRSFLDVVTALRGRGAAAVRELDGDAMRETLAELEALARLADFQRVHYAQIHRISEASAEALRRVLEVIDVGVEA